jgi:UDP-N-acetylmuramoylalanine--D-glutamate ligase
VLRRGGDEETVCAVSDVKLLGRANLLNTLAAAAGSRLAGGNLAGIARAIGSFDRVPERLELIAEVAGVKFYDDTTSTTPASTVASIKALSKPLTLIAGGSEKHLDFTMLAEAIVHDVDHLVLLAGTATLRLEAAVRSAGWKGVVEIAGDMEQAVEIAFRLSGCSHSVLMSPACASFGMFVNEFDRGAAFQRAVAGLKGNLQA